jgi:hypothetical protein
MARVVARFRTFRPDSADDIYRQNVSKARAMARMEIYDQLSGGARAVFKEQAFHPYVEPDENRICEAVARHDVYFDEDGRMIVPEEELNG